MKELKIWSSQSRGNLNICDVSLKKNQVSQELNFHVIFAMLYQLSYEAIHYVLSSWSVRTVLFEDNIAVAQNCVMAASYLPLFHNLVV